MRSIQHNNGTKMTTTTSEPIKRMTPQYQNGSNGSGDAVDNELHSCSKLLRLAKSFNNFYFNGFNTDAYKDMYCQNYQIGIVPRYVEDHLADYEKHKPPEDATVFEIHPDKIELCPGVVGYDKITNAVKKALVFIKEKNNTLTALRGWRNENYDIRGKYGQPPLFSMERAATCLFGLRQYGVDVNGYVVDDEDGSISVWMQRRSVNKPTWPGRLDNFVS
jgi:hypothetical protein